MFFDTYAFVEINKGNERYRKYLSVPIVTTQLNLMEIYYWLLKDFGEEKANEVYENLKTNCIEWTDEDVKEAMKFKWEHKKKNLSYVDCVGYIIAKRLRTLFLTGDKGFKDLPNVEFVK